MTKTRPLCDVCGREAIGFESLGCCTATVCAEHAEPALRNAKPGETIVEDCCVFCRFESPSSDGG